MKTAPRHWAVASIALFANLECAVTVPWISSLFKTDKSDPVEFSMLALLAAASGGPRIPVPTVILASVNGMFAEGSNLYTGVTGSWLSVSNNGGTTETQKVLGGLVMGAYAVGSTVYSCSVGGVNSLQISTDGGANFAGSLGTLNANAVFVSGTTIYLPTDIGLRVSTDGGATAPIVGPGLFASSAFALDGNVYIGQNSQFPGAAARTQRTQRTQRPWQQRCSRRLCRWKYSVCCNDCRLFHLKRRGLHVHKLHHSARPWQQLYLLDRSSVKAASCFAPILHTTEKKKSFQRIWQT